MFKRKLSFIAIGVLTGLMLIATAECVETSKTSEFDIPELDA